MGEEMTNEGVGNQGMPSVLRGKKKKKQRMQRGNTGGGLKSESGKVF